MATRKHVHSNGTTATPTQDRSGRTLKPGWSLTGLVAITLMSVGGWSLPSQAQVNVESGLVDTLPADSLPVDPTAPPAATPVPEASAPLDDGSGTPAPADPSASVNPAVSAPPQPLPEPILDIGIVQRFGQEATDEVIIEAERGDRLVIQFETGGQPQTVTTSRVKLDVVMEPLAEPELEETVVLSNHRSFESAEDSANYWKAKGIEVEIAQPSKWQVWGKRSVYNTPLLRRLLIQNVRAHGSKTVVLDSRIRTETPKAAFIANGFRYHRDRFEIDSLKDQAWLDIDAREEAKRLYGGDFHFQPNAYGTYTLVNEVPLETYLRGVVPYEIGLGAPRTTIEAQAILARTYSLRNLRRFAIDDYELCADTQCQVYWGISGAAEVTDRAIEATRGKVLTYNNELVDALYSSTTGGVTARFSDVWNGPDRPYLQSVVDSVYGIWDLSARDLSTEANIRSFLSMKDGFNEEGWETLRWRREGTLLSLAEDVRAYLRVIQHPLVNFSTLESLEVTERSPSGRVQTLVVRTNLGDIELGKDEVVRALYPPRSTLFYLDPIYEEVAQTNDADTAPDLVTALDSAKANEAIAPSPNADSELQGQLPTPAAAPAKVLKGYAFVGGGFGHGVGMSQTGAYKLGELNWSHERILSFYYPGTTLQQLHNGLRFWVEPEETVAQSAE